METLDAKSDNPSLLSKSLDFHRELIPSMFPDCHTGAVHALPKLEGVGLHRSGSSPTNLVLRHPSLVQIGFVSSSFFFFFKVGRKFY